MTDVSDAEDRGADEALREYLYADIDRIQSVIAQFLGGVPQTESGTTSRGGRLSAGLKGYIEVGGDRRSEDKVERSQIDALFPDLEALLETDGWLVDITVPFAASSTADLQRVVDPGTMVRLTTTAQLFDAAYIAQVLGGASTAMAGIPEVANFGTPSPQPGSPGRKSGQKSPRNRNDMAATYKETGRLEDLVEEFDSATFGGFDGRVMRGLIKTSRGMFLDGLHMIIAAREDATWTATARLQREKRYLDAEPDILFSRYGTSPQEWTIVGTIGHFSSKIDPSKFAPAPDLTGPTGVRRGRFVQFLNSFMALLGASGMSDVPPFPGFSIVPFAVYRKIPRPQAK